MTAITAAMPTRLRIGSFYVWSAVVCVAVAFLGFAPTYFAPIAAGRFAANPIVHIHGWVFFAWTVFFLIQTLLPASGRTGVHRSLGLVGISLATLMVVLGVMAALNVLRTTAAVGAQEAGEAFVIVPLVGIAIFAVLVALAIANVERPEVHKRLMLCASVSILAAPLARPVMLWILELPPGPPPVTINWINLLAFLPIVAGMVHDQRTNGSVHPVYLITLPVLLFLTWVVIPLSSTAAWHAIAKAFLSLSSQFPGPPA